MKSQIIRMPRDGTFPVERTGDLTASTIGALVGVSRFRTRWELWRFHRHGSPLPGDEVTDVGFAGQALEAGIARIVARDRGWTLRKAHVYLRDPVRRIGATPDYWCVAIKGRRVKRFPVDIKNVALVAWRDHWSRGDAAPLSVQLQVQVQAALSGAERCAIAALVAGHEVQVFDYDFRPETWRQIGEHADDFWRQVDANEEPVLDLAMEDYAAVMAAWLEPGAEMLDLSSDNEFMAAVADLRVRDKTATKLGREQRILDEERARLRMVVVSKMRGATRARAGELFVEAPVVTREAYTVAGTSYRQVKILEPKKENAR